MNITQEGLFFTITYFLPGFIMNGIINANMHLYETGNSFTVYKFLLFSVINALISDALNWIFILIFKKTFIHSLNLKMLLQQIVLPIILSYILLKIINISDEYNTSKDEGHGNRFKLLKKCLEFLGFSRTDSIMNTWDYLFYKLMNEGGKQLIITTNSNEKIYAFYGDESFASSGKSKNVSLYIEKTFLDLDFLEDKNYGIYIETKDIKYIEIVEEEKS